MKGKSQGSNQSSAPLGVTDFIATAYNTEAEWSLVAVKAPIDQVAAAFADFRKPKRWLRDVPRANAAEVDDVDSSLVSILQTKGNPWTVVVRELFDVTEFGMNEVMLIAKTLSSKLKTRAITFVAEDTSGAIAYDLFDGGKLLEHAEWEEGGSFFSFQSTLRKQPALDAVTQEFADEVFCREGIYLPACYPKSDGEKVWLCVEKVSAGAVERADLMDLGEQEAGGDEDDDA